MFVHICRISSVVQVLIREHDFQYSNISSLPGTARPGGLALICAACHFHPARQPVKRANGPQLPESRTLWGIWQDELDDGNLG
jgi:hypothetical protein